ncbi:MAG: hypothetical protein HRT89_08115 [Lentisphaeria bacterium]|nr:hypothetical protein [Lentisphaeria bacterium]NQZ68020.1 hypothetical protein [Lentisphaeria bacterium]
MKTAYLLNTTYFSPADMATLKDHKQLAKGKIAKSLNRLPLVINESQWVKHADRYYYLKNEGLYHFTNSGKCQWQDPSERGIMLEPGTAGRNVIVFRKNILSLLTALSLLHIKGVRHKDLSYSKKLTRLKTQALCMNCGATSKFCAKLINSLGWETRRVGGMRGKEPLYNVLDNGHQLFEIYWPEKRKWILVDIDHSILFTRKNRYLSYGELWQLIKTDQEFQLEMIPDYMGRLIDTSEDNATFPSHFTYLPDTHFKSWYREILKVPYFHAKNAVFYTCMNKQDKDHVIRNNPDYTYMSEKEWYAKYYSK